MSVILTWLVVVPLAGIFFFYAASDSLHQAKPFVARQLESLRPKIRPPELGGPADEVTFVIARSARAYRSLAAQAVRVLLQLLNLLLLTTLGLGGLLLALSVAMITAGWVTDHSAPDVISIDHAHDDFDGTTLLRSSTPVAGGGRIVDIDGDNEWDVFVIDDAEGRPAIHPMRRDGTLPAAVLAAVATLAVAGAPTVGRWHRCDPVPVERSCIPRPGGILPEASGERQEEPDLAAFQQIVQQPPADPLREVAPEPEEVPEAAEHFGQRALFADVVSPDALDGQVESIGDQLVGAPGLIDGRAAAG